MDTEQMESEIRDLFKISADDVTDTNAGDTDSGTTDDQEPKSQPGDNTGDDGTAKAAPPLDSATDPTPPAKTKISPEDTQVDPEEKFNKQNSAFAQMRIQNKEYADLIMNLAKATGQTPKNMTEAQDMLKEGLNKVVSKNRNIPEDVLREMEEDKKTLAELKQNQARQKALAGFQQVKDLHGLSREDVNNFADKLIEKNLNPFEQELDLVKEYRNLYFDEIIAKAVDQAVQEERERSIKAQQNSTTPSSQKGISDNTGNQKAPVKSVMDLDKLLDSLK